MLCQKRSQGVRTFNAAAVEKLVLDDSPIVGSAAKSQDSPRISTSDACKFFTAGRVHIAVSGLHPSQHMEGLHNTACFKVSDTSSSKIRNLQLRTPQTSAPSMEPPSVRLVTVSFGGFDHAVKLSTDHRAFCTAEQPVPSSSINVAAMNPQKKSASLVQSVLKPYTDWGAF